MPRINFANIPDAEDYSLIPEGKYLMRVYDVKDDKPSSEGYEMWLLILEILEGEFKGRKVFDRIFFHNEKAVSRVKLICHRLGMDVSKEIDLQPKMLLHRKALVTLEINTYPDKDGREKKNNKIAFAGYEALGTPAEPEAVQEGVIEPVFVDQEGTQEEVPF